MIKRICKYCGKEYETYPSINLFFCSHKCSSDFKKGKTWEELYKNAEKMFLEARGKRNSPSTEFKSGWQHSKKGKEIIKKAKKTCGNNNPSIVENKMKKLIEENNLPFNHVGNGSLIIGTKNPDFVYIKDGRKIIEVFSSYYHRDDVAKYWHQTESGCKEYYNLLGYNCLIVWDKELRSPNEVLKKVRKFMETTLEFDANIKTINEFKKFSRDNFDNDGEALSFIMEKAMEYQAMKVTFFENINYKLDNILEIISQTEKKPEPKESITLLSGKKIEKGGKNSDGKS